MKRGEVHWLELPDLGRRPVLVMTATDLAGSLDRVVVAGLSTTVRHVATEVPVGIDDGLPKDGAVNLVDLRVVPRSLLVERVTSLGQEKMQDVCTALVFSTGCDG